MQPTGTGLSLHDGQVNTAKATLRWATLVIGPGLFSQEAVAQEGHPVEGVAREASAARAAGRDVGERAGDSEGDD